MSRRDISRKLCCILDAVLFLAMPLIFQYIAYTKPEHKYAKTMSEVDSTQIEVQKSVATPKLDNTDPEGLDRQTLFVRGVPYDATSEELSEYFSQFVPVKHAVIVNDEESKSRGFGFVSFTMEDDTILALAESKKNKFKGKFLRVDVAKRRDRKEKSSIERPSKQPTEVVEKRKARLIVRNLPWSCKTPEKLKKLFSQFGAVHDAYIPRKKGGQMSGFAFVTMKKDIAAERAVKQSVGLKIDGREVAVDLAMEKSKWEDIKAAEPEKEEEEEEDEEEEDLTNAAEEADEENDDEEKEDEDDELKDLDDLNKFDSDAEVDEDVELKIDEEEEPRPKANRQEAYSLFIRNIPYDADEDTLKEHFSFWGPVKYALPVVDKVTGIARGSAFVAFKDEESYSKCLENAPSGESTSVLIPDDVSTEYVYQGRILSITATVDRQSASRLEEKNSDKRKEALGKAPSEKDKRNLFLLNEGRITENSALAKLISQTDLEMREKSYKLRVQQLNKNPSLHLSLTRLAIRNLPRALNFKALKALGRKAVVQFATEVKEGKRQPLSKEEINRSVKLKHELGEFELKKDEEANKKKNDKKMGVVRQSKVIMEVKGSGEHGRSRGYGFLEYRDHKTALMGLRWLNAHQVTIEEITEGLTESEKKLAELEGLSKRRLIVEFAVENAQVVKRRRDKVFMSRQHKDEHESKKRERGEDDEGSNKRFKGGDKRGDKKDFKNGKKKGPSRKGNMNKGNMSKGAESVKPQEKSSAHSEEVRRMIGQKRKHRKGK